MSDHFVGEVRIYAGETAPDGWAICDGRLLSIQDFPQLYSVVGTTYGGDGREAFALPNLSGRVAVHAGYRPGLVARRLGESGGSATVALDEGHLPIHEHDVAIPNGRATLGAPSDSALLASASSPSGFSDKRAGQLMSVRAIGKAGASQPHNNMQPYLALNYIIALTGIVPEPD